jgi:cellulose synthase/poly-beta-1,6-N-acetylglucosamine synthase-like glycosyltransferase
VTILLVLILAPLIILTLCFALELVVGIVPLKQSPFPATAAANVVIIVPAHDEEALIGHTLAGLKAAAEGAARILVVADNCSDGTAAEARRAGVEVIERSDAERRGKGFALDHARRHLGASPPDLTVIIDADCRIDALGLRRLIAACAANARPCQATYLLDPATDAAPPVQISNFAFYVRNVIRQRALQRLIGRVHMLGTGMALPWRAFDREGLATADIVEDLRMGIELAEAGSSPQFVESAQVWSKPETAGNTLVQRKRWEGGFLAHSFGLAPRMLLRSLRRGDAGGVFAALDLMVPPLALLISVDLGALVFAGAVTWFFGASAWPMVLLMASLLLTGAALGGAWLAGGWRFVSLAGLIRIPLYLVWKLPLYYRLATRGTPQEWLRTRGGDQT